MPPGRVLKPLLLASALLCGCGRSAEPPGGALSLSIGPEDAAEPARAAIRAFVPTLGGDPGFEELVAEALVEAHKNRLGERAVETREELRQVRAAISEAGLPDVFVGIPYTESRMKPGAVSPQCAGGPWQFLPEVAVSEGLRVRDCELAGATDDTGEPSLFSPGRKLPARSERVYLGRSGCRITSCAVDDRRDLRRSTDAALSYLEKMGRDPVLADHPQRVALQILAFNAGLGGAKRVVDATDGEPFGVMPECAGGDCLVLPRESARYVPRVVAAAAVVACNAATPEALDLSDWARSDLCRALHEAGMAPEPVTAKEALAAAAAGQPDGWKVGLAAVSVAGFGMEADRAAADGALGAALAAVPGVSLVFGVPGEDPAALVDQGATVVLSGELGRRGSHAWLRLERWDVRDGEPVASGGAIVLLDGPVGPEEALELAADALLRPVRDRQAETIASLVDSQREALSDCLPPGSPIDEAFARVSLRVDADGHAAAFATGPDELPGEVTACIEDRVARLTFPRELAGAGTTLELGIESPAIADAAEE
jgi:hypothetical protein